MESQQQVKRYDFQSRYNNWEIGFHHLTQELDQEERNSSDDNLSNNFDEVSVEFVNVQDKLAVLQEQVKDYNSDHKTELFYSIQDTKNELQVKLDKIELNNQEDLRLERRALYEGLDKLSNTLNSKIHEEGLSDCTSCHQRAVIVPQLHRK